MRALKLVCLGSRATQSESIVYVNLLEMTTLRFIEAICEFARTRITHQLIARLYFMGEPTRFYTEKLGGFTLLETYEGEFRMVVLGSGCCGDNIRARVI